MGFRIVMLCLAFWLTPAQADVQDKLDSINDLLYQYPTQALNKINALDSITSPIALTEAAKLRLSLLRCEAFLQLGENEAAINIARISEAKAKTLKLDQARPYFLNCMAGAFNNYGDFRQALPLLDASIMLSREQKQPQSLVNGLRLRGIIDTHIDSYSSAFEDLGLASDIYLDIQSQERNWALPPQISIKIALSQLLEKNGKHQQAYELIDSAIASEDLQGKVLLAAYIQVAKLAQFNQALPSEQLIKQAKNLLPELETAFELALSYTQIAQLERNRGDNTRALQLLEISLNTFIKKKSTIERLRAQRLLAQVLFDTGNESKAIVLINQAIETALQTAKFYELVLCYQVLSDYYVEKSNFELGYQYQVKKFTAAENGYNFIKDTRLLQLNARLSRLQISSLANDRLRLTQVGQSQFQGEYLLFALLTLVLMITFKFKRKSTKQEHKQASVLTISPEQKIDRLISHSKLISSPLSLILIDPIHIFHADLPLLQSRLQHLLREQDIVTHSVDEEIVILLLHTQEAGSLRIIKLIEVVMEPLLHGYRPNIGYAKLQQQDNLGSLIKRAKVKQLLLKNKKQPKTEVET
ncbi:histidine kinase [Shewanella eurypsychrophilus]|uniref:Histidine kinase n=1 Tax=Shewanella eurypsychrophilus TaxID=2593656 RepID=A0ABX6V0Y9_9GAMM|nr:MULTISPECIES: histidine kinase [Shewanella]QFU20714.1 histidine kinase [Shewanella sp. YLB-09]QFU20993.1 histidine kinase [Shewanella sp. YLB-09]QPG56281.1 histidine kinase [Shewanella eurypsychrophilus]